MDAAAHPLPLVPLTCTVPSYLAVEACRRLERQGVLVARETYDEAYDQITFKARDDDAVTEAIRWALEGARIRRQAQQEQERRRSAQAAGTTKNRPTTNARASA